jgi:iron complex outermembrane receptor protein
MSLNLRLLGLVVATSLGAASGAIAQDAAPLDEVVVTGSRLAGASRLAPIESLDRQDLAASGVSEASQLVRILTANSGSEARIDQLNQPQSSGTAQVNLRNLGLGSTLVLVDGLRWTNSGVVATDGSAFVDINSLVPLIALERIDVVKDGASALYGSDAIAGVVNFVTRRDVAVPSFAWNTVSCAARRPLRWRLSADCSSSAEI